MGNFYSDNNDIKFLFRHVDLGTSAEICEAGFKFTGEFDHAPADANEAIQNYEMVLDSLGELCAEFIAPRAEDVDRQGNVLNEDGSVTRAKGIAEAIENIDIGKYLEKKTFTFHYWFTGQGPDVS